jgi:hypothetical protein
MHVLFGISVLVATAHAVGRIFFGAKQGAATFGLALTLAIIAITGSVAYYLFALPHGIVWIMIVLNLVFLAWKFRRAHITSRTPSWLRDWWLVPFCISLTGACIIMIKSATVLAVRSPWDVVSPWFFVASALSVFFGIILISRHRQWARIVAPLLMLLFFSVAWIVFPIGYGFDPFLHRAAEQTIFDAGVITPKSPYYIGQYAIVVYLATLTGLSVSLIDILLVPVLAALTIPALLLATTKRREGALVLLSPLLLPPFTALFIMTTPQSLGYILLFCIILLSQRKTSPRILAVLALATLLIHPIAGIPAVLYLVLRWLQSHQSRTVFFAALVASSAALPLAFLFAATLLPQLAISLHADRFIPWLTTLPIFRLYRETRFDVLFDAIYVYGFNILITILFFVITGAVISYRKKIIGQFLPLALAIVFILNGAILNGFFSFDVLIGYENTNYGNRLFLVALLFFIPAFFSGFTWWTRRISEHGIIWRFGLYVVFTGALTTALFLTYPQNVDRYAVSHAVNTSAADIRAVNWIDDHAGGAAYVVLANQSVSAAAMREFGFAHYYDGFYFYPLPTSAPLYRDYLDMVYGAPTIDILERSQERVGVERAYFVLNRYWTNAESIRIVADEQLTPLYRDADIAIYSTN